MTVLSPFDHTGGRARLIAGDSVGSTPLPNQYSGRHISDSNSLPLLIPAVAAVTSGKIHVGAGYRSAQVTVPACCGPVAAAGTVPNAPPEPAASGMLELPLHPAAAAAPTTATAAIMER